MSGDNCNTAVAPLHSLQYPCTNSSNEIAGAGATVADTAWVAFFVTFLPFLPAFLVFLTFFTVGSAVSVSSTALLADFTLPLPFFFAAAFHCWIERWSNLHILPLSLRYILLQRQAAMPLI